MTLSPDLEKKIDDLISEIEPKSLFDYQANKEEIELLFQALHSNNKDILIPACLILSDEDANQLSRLFEEFDQYPNETQYLLIGCFAENEGLKSIQFIFKTLQNTENPKLTTACKISLTKTATDIFPILLTELSSDNKAYLTHLKQIIKDMGLKKIKLYLASFPQIPLEQVFRDIFGDQDIDELKQK